jgi:hypothetical protein
MTTVRSLAIIALLIGGTSPALAQNASHAAPIAPLTGIQAGPGNSTLLCRSRAIMGAGGDSGPVLEQRIVRPEPKLNRITQSRSA